MAAPAVYGPFDVGDRIRVGNHSGDTARVPFKNSAGADTDPTAVTIGVEKPDGTLTSFLWPSGTPAATRETLGRFYADVSLDQDGIYEVELVGTGAVESAERWQLFVRKRLVG